MTFKAVRIYVFTAVDLETQLIAHYGGPARVRWNGSGFGSNDPGRERDTTTYKAEHFDAQFPIDIDRSLDLTLPATASAFEILTALKAISPYIFRFEGASARSRRPHEELVATMISTSGIVSPFTARKIVKEVVGQLPAGWQATQLPSHLILYKEDRLYPQGKIIAKSPC